MTGEMVAAERLVRSLVPPGVTVPIPQPFALDESNWLLIALDKGLLELRGCPRSCPRLVRTGCAAGDHFETGSGDPHHLFAAFDRDTAYLQRGHLPAIAAYARAVLDFGYDPAAGALLARRRAPRRLVSRLSPSQVRGVVEFVGNDGRVDLQILPKGDRRLTRRLAAALDAHGRLSALDRDTSRELDAVAACRPRWLWLAGPNTIDPACHVFRVEAHGDDLGFVRVDTVPAPGRSARA